MGIKSFNKVSLLPSDYLKQIKAIDEKIMDFPWSNEQWDNFVNKELNWMIVIKIENKSIQAFALFQLSLDEWCHLIKIGVSDNSLRKGFATYLLKYSLEQLKGDFETCDLEVRESNLAAVQLYQNLSFKKVNLMKSYYSDGSDAIKMICDLR